MSILVQRNRVEMYIKCGVCDKLGANAECLVQENPVAAELAAADLYATLQSNLIVAGWTFYDDGIRCSEHRKPPNLRALPGG